MSTPPQSTQIDNQTITDINTDDIMNRLHDTLQQVTISQNKNSAAEAATDLNSLLLQLNTLFDQMEAENQYDREQCEELSDIITQGEEQLHRFETFVNKVIGDVDNPKENTGDGNGNEEES